MANQDLKNNISVAASVAPNAYTVTATGSAVDMLGYEAATVEFVSGTITDGTHTPSVEESSDNSAWSAVASSDLQGTLTALASDAVQEVGYIGSKRYVRAIVTVAGATTGGKYAAVVVRGAPRDAPV